MYLAQIACEARRGWMDKPGKVQMKDMLLVVKKEKEPGPDMTLTGEERVKRSKSLWAGVLGINLDKSKN